MISVITPCRNAADTIERTIKSVIKQDVSQLEYIIIDGASEDGTLDIIKRYANENSNIRYISERDNSMTEALNKGFRMATGDIVCSINADDEYMPNSLKLIESAFREKNFTIAIAGTDFIKGDKVFYSTYPRFMCNRFLLNVLDCSAPECSVFFARDTLQKEHFFNEKYKYTQDYEMYIRLMKHGYRITYLDDTVSKFYLSDNQYSTHLKKEMINEPCKYNEHPIIYKFLKVTHINNKIKVLFRWTVMGKSND